MASELITGIGELTTLADGEERRRDAALVIDGDRIAWIGAAASAPAADRRFDAAGGAVLPGWVDSHSHLVFAGDRSAEFEERMAGRAYSAGGIGATVTATRAASDDDLRANLRRLRAEAQRQGTTFLETKTGYGLDVETERRSAELAAEVADVVTFLGAHVVPAGIDPRAYVDLVTGPMLEAVRPWVRFIDVFCETGAFDVDQSREVLAAGRAAGSACACTATSSASPAGSRSQSSSAPRASTTAITSRSPTSTRSPARTPWRPCCRRPTSRPGRRSRPRAS
ncbi:hypothetical protein GCM10025881_23620 [Pseudolysinimonas kribbensis]|uniref:imidazolonepropionase n=1 Tax=Pseudolysinimonas kribbensis TaxID=433641 RepID=A0ABQ6K7N0_9MICO|nr:hypothetical protein GCM10025881_23620 [Pseudolysinimonas kribbensis]